MSHRKTDLGIPSRKKSAKVVLVVVGIMAILIGVTETNLISFGEPPLAV